MTSISYDLDKIRIYLENIDTKLEEVKLSYVDFGLEGNSAGLNSFVYSYARLFNFLVEYRSFVKNDILDVCNTVKAYVEKDNSIAKHLSGNEEGFLNFTANINNAYISDNSQTIPIDTVDLQTGLSSFRISRLDTENTASKLTEELLSLSARLIELKKLIDVFSQDTASALTGDAATAMKNYWAEVHIPIVKEIDAAVWTLNKYMLNYRSELYQLVNDDSYFVLSQSDMEAAVAKLTAIQSSLESIVDDVDSKISSYSTLLGVNVTIPNGRPMLYKYQQTASKIQNLVELVVEYESSKITLVKGYIDDYVTNMTGLITLVATNVDRISKYPKGSFNRTVESNNFTLVADAKACERDEVKLILAFESTHPEYADAMNKFLDSDSNGDDASLSPEMRIQIKYWAYTAPEPFRTVIMQGIMNGEIKLGSLTIGESPFEKWIKDHTGQSLTSHNNFIFNTVNYRPADLDPNSFEDISTVWHEMGHGFDNIGSPYWGSVSTYKTYNAAMGKDVSFYDAMEYDVYDNPNNPHSVYSLGKKCNAEGIPGNIDNVIAAFKHKNVFLSKEDLNLYREICKKFIADANDYYNSSSSPYKYDNFGGVGDTYGGLTHNSIIKNRDPQTGAPAKNPQTGAEFFSQHHDAYLYWNKPDWIAQTEFYAEYFSANVTGNAEKVALMKEFYPEATKVADSYTKDLADK